jgi:hypothetical protein
LANEVGIAPTYGFTPGPLLLDQTPGKVYRIIRLGGHESDSEAILAFSMTIVAAAVVKSHGLARKARKEWPLCRIGL